MSRSAQFAALAARDAIPTIHEWRVVVAGGLISYGASLAHRRKYSRWLAWYVGRDLTQQLAADLPVLQPTTFELVINLKPPGAWPDRAAIDPGARRRGHRMKRRDFIALPFWAVPSTSPAPGGAQARIGHRLPPS